jgi:DNA repair protein RadC
MNIKNCSTPDLLSVLVGKGMAKKLSQVPLSVLFGMRANRQEMVCESEAPYVPALIISAAKELFVRALEEDIHNHPVSFTAPQVVKDYLRLVLGGRQQEVFMVLFLDAQHRLIASEELFHGTLTQTSVYPREVVKRALIHNAAAVMLSHNHPSGVAEPSSADRSLTDALKQALGLVDVRVLDHIVIGEQEALSFAERGLI